MGISRFLMASILVFFLGGCFTHRPCIVLEDEPEWLQIKGNRWCAQKENQKKELVNHGDFKQYYGDNESVAVTGQYNMGEKDGVWTKYNPQGKRIMVRYYEDGVEKTLPATRNPDR